MSKWNDGNSTPRERGWYLRDYRNSGCHDCPPFSVDLFEPDPDRYSILYPGAWYVHDDKHGLNDAYYPYLPWKKIKT